MTTKQAILILFWAAPLAAQGAKNAESQERFGRFSFGFRLRGLPEEVIQSGSRDSSSTSPAVSSSFTATDNSAKVGIGAMAEYRLSSKFRLAAELLFHRAAYSTTGKVYTGVDNPNTSADERRLTESTERTRVRLWDVPVMLRYEGLRESGILSRVFVTGGGTTRFATHIRTGTEFKNPDNTQTYNERPAAAASPVFGVVAGAGLRLVDDFKIKVIPEFRFTRWTGSTFDLNATRSRLNQMEAGLAFTF